MGRSIIRSKIFAKQNLPSTGGGGGSAISVSDEGTLLTNGVTSFNFTGYGVTASAVANAVTVTVDNHLAIQVKNGTGAPVVKGAVCYLKTGSTSTTVPEILLADATSETTSSKTLGIIHTTIPNGGIGLLVVNGELEGTGSEPLDTSAYTIGTKLWLSTTPGQVIATPPAFPNHTVFIGHVTRSQNVNGRILVEIQNGFEMNELHDTKFTSLAQNDVMMYDANTGPRPFWYNQKMVVGITSTALLALQSSGTLVPGVWYSVSDKPASIEAVLIQAVSSSFLNPKGIAIILNGGVTTITTDCWYDLSANTPYKIFDPKYNNTVEGWTSIQTFKWNNSNWYDNYISEGGKLFIDNTTSVSSFFNNTITDGSTLYILGTVSTNEISGNTLVANSYFNLNGAFITNVKNNTLSTCYIDANTSSFDSIVGNIISCESTIHFETSTWNYFSNNLISGNSVINAVGIGFGSFLGNRISSSTIAFTNSTDNFTYNEVSGSSVSVISSLNNDYNLILNSTLSLDNGTVIDHCSIEGMGVIIPAELNGTNYGYSGCSYLINSDSTFYIEYNLDDPTIYDPAASSVTMYAGHQECMGKLIFRGNGSPVYQITNVINIPEHNFITFAADTSSLVEVRDTSGGFKFPVGITAPDLANPDSYIKFSAIRRPTGTTGGGQLLLIDYLEY